MIGQTISHYKIIEKLGAGGMGVVYKAEDTKLKRTVALKFLPSDHTQDSELKKRFIREAQSASALDHPNICTIYEIDQTDDGQMFIAMAYYDGKTREEKLKDGPLPTQESLQIVWHITHGLSCAHENGIVHRDIKPANILITQKGEVKILDFGLAKLKGQTVLTKTTSTLGTIAYMSPEQARGDIVDHRTDIWSLGVVIYRMLAGELPFKGEYDQAVIYSIINEDPEPLTSKISDFPEDLENLIIKALSKDIDQRYQHIDEFAKKIETYTDNPDTKQILSKPHKKKILSRTYLISSIAFLAILICLAVYYFVLQKPPSEKLMSIAVLPLENFSGDPEQEYFCDALTDILIGEIAQIKEFHVISKTSIMQYKEVYKPIPAIAADLNVNYIVEGSVLKSGNRIRITAQLIEAREDRHLWANNYEHDLKNIFKIQS